MKKYLKRVSSAAFGLGAQLLVAAAISGIALAPAFAATESPAGSRAGHSASMTRIVLKGMVCAYCAQGFERAIRRHGEVSSVHVRLAQHDALIQYKAGESLSEAALREGAREAGLGVERVESL